MIPSFHHNFVSSFILWADHYLLDKGQAYSNKTGYLYPYIDDRMPSDFNIYASPYKQWVSDSSITSADVISEVWVNTTGKSRPDGVFFDYDNGRVLLSGSAYTSTDTVTGSFAVKDFNIYYSNESEEDLVIENKFKPNHYIYDGTETGIAPYDQVVPAVFISTSLAKNEPLCFGGMDKSAIMARAVVLSDDAYKLDGALSLFADANNVAFRQVNFEDYPFEVFGDVKNDNYNYETLAQSSTLFYIDEVTVSKLSDRIKRSVLNDLFVGFADFEVAIHRYPRL